ncbi:MAG: dockerin type I repeat-containing protein [Clostridia bacterium]|nr:dockerin type I repeat-containing protein [Clostridia bacterium]
MKKVIAILLTLVLSLSIIVPASAEENESYVTLDKDIIYLKVGEQAELNISEVNLAYETSVPTGNPNYETWTVADDEIVSLQLTGGEEGNVAYPDNLVNQTAVITALKTGTTIVKVERGGFGAYAYDECTVVVSDTQTSDDLFKIFDCETEENGFDIGYSTHGPVKEMEYVMGYYAPEPVEGTHSYMVHALNGYLGMHENASQPFNANEYEYIEFDVYPTMNIVCDLSVTLVGEEESEYTVEDAVLREGWVHISIPVSAFVGSDSSPSLENISRISVNLKNIVKYSTLFNSGERERPSWIGIYFDNYVATRNGAGKENELKIFGQNELPALRYGNVDNENAITASDALVVLQHSVGKTVINEKRRLYADVDGNGEVSAVDALLVLQYSVQKIRKFPVEVAQLPDTLMLFDCETSEGCGIYTEQQGTHYGPVSENIQFGSPKPVQGDYTYCIKTTGNQMMLNYTFPDSVDLSTYDYIEFDIYSNIEIVCNLNIDIATDTAAINGANWGLNNSWIPGERWYHVKMPVSAFSEFDGSLTDINRIRFLLTNIYDGVELVDNGYPTTPDYTYVYFDNIIATKNGAGKDNELIDIDTVFENPPEWFEEYRNGVTCGGGLYLPVEVLFDAENEEGCEVYTANFANEDLIGLTEANSYSGAPTPTQGSYTYCINTTIDQMEFSKTLQYNYNITPYSYIEMDIYSTEEIVFNWKFSVNTNIEDTTGATWPLISAWLPANKWTHIKMPISEFIDLTPQNGGSFANVNKIIIELTGIVDGVKYVDSGRIETLDNTYIYIDNVITTVTSSITENELIDYETVLLNPPSWFEEYRRQFEQF